MGKYTLNSEDIKQLKEIVLDPIHQDPIWIKNKIKEVLPNIFKTYEVGKYYKCVDDITEFYVKCLGIEDGGVVGYGLDFDEDFINYLDDNKPWFNINDVPFVKEISEFEFLEKMVKFISKDYGLKKGDKIKLLDGREGYVIGEPYITNGIVAVGTDIDINSSKNRFVPIFKDGKFSEIIKTTEIPTQAEIDKVLNFVAINDLTLKTSEDWYLESPEPMILDPDGWDKSDYQYSFREEFITYVEFNSRRMMSTCKHTITQKNNDRL